MHFLKDADLDLSTVRRSTGLADHVSVLDVTYFRKVSSNDLWVGRRFTIRQRRFHQYEVRGRCKRINASQIQIHTLTLNYETFRCQFANYDIAIFDQFLIRQRLRFTRASHTFTDT